MESTRSENLGMECSFPTMSLPRPGLDGATLPQRSQSWRVRGEGSRNGDWTPLFFSTVCLFDAIFFFLIF